jgi:hypothetical protein
MTWMSSQLRPGLTLRIVASKEGVGGFLVVVWWSSSITSRLNWHRVVARKLDEREAGMDDMVSGNATQNRSSLNSCKSFKLCR